MQIKNSVSNILGQCDLFKSYLGKRTDDIGYKKLVALGRDSGRSTGLTRAEKRAIKEMWGRVVSAPLRIGYSFYEMVKGAGDFSPAYLPSAYYMPYAFEPLNAMGQGKALEHKCLQKLFFPECSQPDTIVAKIGGVLFDSQYRKIGFKESVSILASQQEDMIFKPATDTSMGRGVKLISNASKDYEALLKSPFDFIIQKRARQSDFMSLLNSSSLNCVRITTLNINGKSTATSRIVKIGAKGSIVDNIGSGSGGMMIGVSEDGIINNYGYRVDGTRLDSHNGLKFGGLKIPNFQLAIDMAVKAHQSIPNKGIIGWDIAFDENDMPFLIEANSFWPGITIEQIASGPIFASRTEEVVNYIVNHRES